MKICSKCSIVKALSEFVRSKDTTDGTINNCKACMQIYRNLNKDKIQASRNKYLLKDGIREKMREYRRTWKQKILLENPEITKLFIVSEDMNYINELHKAFPDSYFIPNVFRRTDETDEYINRVHCWPNVSTKRPDHCKLLGEETIIQTKLLGKCDYLFGRLSGVFAGAVLWNENIKKVFKI
jgi:hypothetical protein